MLWFCVAFICQWVQCSRNFWAANSAGVKIDLWLSSDTAEISLKCLTCYNKLGATISYICSPCRSLLYWMFFEAFPDVMQVVKPAVGQLGLKQRFILKTSNLTLFPSHNNKKDTLPSLSVSWIWLCLKTGLFSLQRLPRRAPPSLLRWMGNCVSGAVPSPQAWQCRSADWQVRRRVRDKAAQSAANGSGGGTIVSQLPGQPPLNESVRGMRPDGSYITG